MRTSIKLALGASAFAIAAPASAATFFFNSGNYVPGATAPEPLLSPDVLEMQTASNKVFNAVTFINQSGTVNWRDGTIFLGGNAMLDNRSVWNLYSNDSMVFTSGGGTFLNSGTLSKLGGAGASGFSVNFTNTGVLDAQIGSINFTGGALAFNAGSVFTGAGAVNVSGSAGFNGGFTSSNLNLSSGTMSGNGAVLNGTADWLSGTLSGGWTVANGSDLNAISGSNKIINNANVTNAGTVNWSDGTLFLGGNALVTNNGQWNAINDSSLTFTSGGGTFVNNDTFAKTGGAGATSVSVNFTNNGIIDAQTGSINFTSGALAFNAGSVFTGAGAVNVSGAATFSGAFSSSNLNLSSSTMTGNAAVLNGSADWLSGTLAGGWTVASGSELNAISGSNKVFNSANVTNAGTVNWSDGTLFLGGNALVTNNGQWNAINDSSLTFTSGGGTFVNDDTFAKTGGIGVTAISTNFTNTGTIDAQTGSINFTGGALAFNDGSVFSGSGAVNVSGSATFNGGFTSSNLNLSSGTMTGDGAVLNGTADWLSGTLAGGWTVASGAEMNFITGSNKVFNGAIFTNAGTVNWNDGTLFLGSSSALTNAGTLNLTSDNVLTVTSGGGSLTNNGLMQKTAGGGTSAIDVPFDNNGTVNVLSGTIALPANFVNDGTMAGTGRYSLSGTLTNNGTIAPGDIGATGSLALSGNYLQTASGALASQLFSIGSFDQFNISGTGSLNGTLALSCLSGCMVVTGDSYVLLDSVGALSGVFANVTTSGFGNGFQYDLIYDYDNDLVRLTVLDAGVFPGGVPEPSTWALLILGFGTIGGAMRRKRIAFRLA